MLAGENWDLDVCKPSDSHCYFERFGSLKLPRIEPVKVGHIQNLPLEPEKNYEVKTLAVNPPIFEIPGFLSESECDHIITLAEKQGLKVSSTVRKSLEDDTQNLGSSTEKEFAYWDTDNNSYIDTDEMLKGLELNIDFTPDKETVLEMYSQTQLDKDNDEFKERNTTAVAVFVRRVKDEQPHTKSRHSRQAWLNDVGPGDRVMKGIQGRVQKLTKLPMELVQASEYLQVVNYGPKGHYNCHLDSDFPSRDLECCHYVGADTNNCRICRYLTVLYFLNDVEEGGETAFPVADNSTFDDKGWMRDDESLCNLAKSYHKANVVAKPSKGKAIMWYNHVIDRRTRWMGALDHLSFHGGCDVRKGRKWIANNWISVGNERKRDIWNWIDLASEQSEENDRKNGSGNESQSSTEERPSSSKDEF